MWINNVLLIVTFYTGLALIVACLTGWVCYQIGRHYAKPRYQRSERRH